MSGFRGQNCVLLLGMRKKYKLAFDLSIFKKCMGKDDLCQRKSLGNHRFDLPLQQQREQGGEVLSEPFRMVLLESGDAVKHAFLPHRGQRPQHHA